MGRNIDVSAAEFATVRAVLKLAQGEFAERLGVSRRTVIRGEQRGIELPPSWKSREGDRGGLRGKWDAARTEAESRPADYVAAAKSDTIAEILAKMSQAPERGGYHYYGRNHVEEFRERVAGLEKKGDIKTRAKVSRVAARKQAKKSKRKLARRKK